MAPNSNKLQDETGLPDDVADLLRAYAAVEIPTDFLADALHRFDAATAAQARTHRWMALGAGLGGVVAVAVPILWCIIFNFTLFSKIIAAVGRLSILVLSAILDLWYQLPELSFSILIALWMVLFCCAVMLMKTFRHAAAAKPPIYEHNVPV